MLHSVGIGEFSVSAQVAVTKQLSLIRSPDALDSVRYPGYAVYRATYEALRPIYPRLARIV
jgi:hypothetical protein